ncbi:hypothetical protein [Myroides odoratus]|uniref:hypothetical protein n=1 Tax=Myroides odoratus TaxID=256 RepID=UPI0033429F95
MNDLTKRIRLIFFPMVKLTLLVIVGLSFLHWLLFIVGDLPVREDVYLFFLPIVVPPIAVFFMLRPRLKQLQFKQDKMLDFYCVLFSIAMIAPTMIAQNYLDKTMGKLTTLEDITQVDKEPKSKYYTVNRYHLDTQKVGWYTEIKASGKTSYDLLFRAYAVFPIVKRYSDQSTMKHTYWLCVSYKRNTGNPKNDQQLNLIYQRFIREVQSEFKGTNFRSFTFIEGLDKAKDRGKYAAALANLGHKNVDEVLIFKPHFERFESRIQNQLLWFFVALGLSLALCFALVFFAKLKK